MRGLKRKLERSERVDVIQLDLQGEGNSFYCVPGSRLSLFLYPVPGEYMNVFLPAYYDFRVGRKSLPAL